MGFPYGQESSHRRARVLASLLARICARGTQAEADAAHQATDVVVTKLEMSVKVAVSSRIDMSIFVVRV